MVTAWGSLQEMGARREAQPVGVQKSCEGRCEFIPWCKLFDSRLARAGLSSSGVGKPAGFCSSVFLQNYVED